MKEFVDKHRKASERFEKLKASFEEGNIEELKKELKALLEEDPYFFEPYILLNEIYELEGNLKQAEDVLEEAYKKVMELIAPDGKLPERLEWKHPTNRHIIRALLNVGIFYWELGELEKALDVFRKIYSMNPSDEVGVRFYILAILEGMGFEEFEQVFSRDGEYDHNDLKRWFEKHSINYPDVFRASR